MPDEVMDDRALNESMDEDIRSTLAEINARNEEVEQQPAQAVTPASESTAEITAAESTRARDESGKFIAKDKTEQPAALEQASQPNAQEATAPVAAAPTDALLSIDGKPLDVNRPPSSWTPAAKAAYANLTPEQRKILGQEIYRREGDFHKGNSAIKENADFGQNIRTKFEPYKMLMQAEGSTPEQGIDEYLRTAALFRVGTPQQKMGALYQIDKQFNCGFEQEFQRLVAAEVARVTGQPAQQPQQQQPQQFHDPRVDELLTERQQEQQRRQQEEDRVNQDAVNTFIAATDDKGTPLYPFVDNVMDDMLYRIPAIRGKNPALPKDKILEMAYDAAVWANPETRAVLQSQQAAKANQPAETQRRVEAARHANAVNMPKRGAIPASQASGHFALGTPESDDSIRETYRQLQATN